MNGWNGFRVQIPTVPMTETAARLFKCLSEELRVRLVRILAEEELNVQELQAVLDVPQSTLSRHLAVLKDAELVHQRKQGTAVYYRLARGAGANGATDDLIRLVTNLVHDDRLAGVDTERLEGVREERRRAVRDYFDHHGQSWDAFHQNVADHNTKGAAILRLVPEGLTVLDAGCGQGYLLPDLCAVGARVIAVDNSPKQLEKARERAHALGLTSRIEFREGDLLNLPLAAASVDAAFAYLALHHVPSPEAAVRELTRVLKPDGRLVITDFRAHDESWLATEHADLWLGFDPAQVVDWMQKAGLADIRVEDRPYAKDGKVKTPGRSAAGLFVFVASGRAPSHHN